MTDSTKSATTRAGLTVERLYTTPGVHPYDEVTWERRDVVQTNWRTGDTVFEQRGVEFPDFWSVNASTIVTSKYFRGAVGSVERESSLRQLVDRVVLTYVKAGRDNGYFATPDDAEVFEHELTWMLLHQVFSFNSPVWFNVGTSSPQQVSACQPYDALVSTPDGLVPIGKLVEDDAVGAKVYDAHGLTRVLAVKANGVKDVLRLHTKAGYTLDVTADHLIWKSSDDRGSGRFVEAGTLRAGDKLEWHRRDAHGEAEIEPRQVAEAALAGWMQSDGFVGQYGGTNRSLTLEAMTVTPAELAWVAGALDTVFPAAHQHERTVVTQDRSLDCRRTRLYGNHLREFVDAWGLRARGVDMVVPGQLFTAPLPVVAAYLRSIFQAEGFVSARARSTVVEVDMIGEDLIRGMQSLLLRFGIFSRVGYKADRRADRKGCWALRIQNAGDRRIFADEIGFIDERKAKKLERSFDLPGMAARETKRLEVARIEPIGAMEVYDIQTESGEYLSGNLRVHNCFILAVDDNMDSILNWYREEGLIFKGGSGSGLNISKIRSAKELLRSSGGTASGPVSFMRGADASAGTIKSGGATRRAAKMVVLDVDHPDIAEFVATKAREEDKIRVLRDAGFDMDLGGHDISSVQYQNANNSVRVTDEFMRAVEEGSEFALRGRLTGEVIETVDAQQLWGDIAQAAWECADPGVQYDGTINDWHTTPESGRITASNPCCFTGDTLVSTEQGALEFELLTKRVEAGETVRVLTLIEFGDAAAFSLAPVSLAWVAGETDTLAEVTTGRGLVLRCTPEHRFLTESGWVEAQALTMGQELVSDYERDTVASVRELRLDEPVRVYDLEVPGSHNFVVEASGLPGVVVHNSEYMHLDNSSCNLASLNLMKFLTDDGSFDAVRFARAVEFVITAMDISICFADFPTEAIGETTRSYRQLGIGYANLGALLMASGLAYDSEGGRALAASITSLMTGAAYKRSAELAGVVGPYDGYARNATPHTRVMRKHQAANDAVRTVHPMDSEVHAAATKAWADGLAIGAENGWRNAQASVIAPTGTIAFMLDADTTGIEPDFSLVKFKKLVGGGSMQIVNQTVPRALTKLGYQDEQIEAIVEYIAEHGHVIDAPGLRQEHYDVFDCAMGERSIKPMGHVRMMAAAQPFLSGAISKCVVGETLLTTADGLVRIGSLHQGELADSFRDEIIGVASLGGQRKTDAFYYGGVRPVRQVVLRSGHRVIGTPNHRVLRGNQDGLDWVHLSQIQPGDFVAQQYGSNMWATVPPSFRDFAPSRPYGSQKPVTIPEEMTADLAFLLGAYASEGHTHERTWSVVITNSVDSVLERVRQAWADVFGIQARIERREGKCPQVIASSKTVVEFLRYLGAGTRASDKRIPDAVLRSPRHMVLSFLQGLALDAYSTKGPQAKWAICLDSPRLLDDLQAVLTNLGVLHSRISKHNSVNGKIYDEVYASGQWARLMIHLVPFLEPVKAATAAAITGRAFPDSSTSDVVPFVTARQLYEAIPRSKSGRYGHSLRREFAYLLDPRTKHPSMRSLARIASVPGVQLPQAVYDVLHNGIHFSPVVSVEDAGEREVYDVSVPTTHAFVGNGLVNHNTVNLPESSTVEDIADVYFQGWKIGLKALAVYRDNCKVGQPLSDGRGKHKATSTEESAAPAELARPVRTRLPKSRPSLTTSFTVGGAEGYMTAGSYPDDGLGEVFLKLGKQGSTLAGVMDAFSMAISISLQYGVPLETYVQKFTNMKFEPAGLTDDPDVRMSQSIMDYIFRRLALDHLPFERRAALGIYTAEERQRQLETGSYEEVADGNGELPEAESLKAASPAAAAVKADPSMETPEPVAETARPAPAAAHTTAELLEEITGSSVDAPLCFTCGTKMRPAGSCFVCEGCGSTSGCS